MPNCSPSQSAYPVAMPDLSMVCWRLVRTTVAVRSMVSVTEVGTSFTHTRSPVTHWVVLTEHWHSSISLSLQRVQFAQDLSRTGMHASFSNSSPGRHTVQSWHTPS
jgi:hypothetical protein